MLNITLQFDHAEFDRSARATMDENIIPALVDTVNTLADLAIDALVEAQSTFLDRPTPFTQKAWVRGRTVVKGNDSVVGDVHLLPIQAEYLQYVIDGGVRRAGDYATTALGPLIPGKDDELDSYGNLPRDYVQRMLADPDVAWVHLSPGKPPALIRHRAGQPVEILALIIEKAVNKPNLPVYDIIGETIATGASKAFADALQVKSKTAGLPG